MEQKTSQQKTKDFYRMVEAGDIALFNYIEEAVFFLGYTKVGKTSSCHIICGSPLRAQKINGELVYRPSTNKYQAKVGNSMDSQTQIPNIFQIQLKDPKTNEIRRTVVLDQPGYGDTFGFHRIFSNGYFHYRSFSKTGKIKFVLTFSQKDLINDAAKFKSTISNFVNSFNNYQSIRQGILAATSFLVTKVQPPFNNIQTLKNKLISLRDNGTKNMGSKQKANFQSMITEIVTKNKVYIIEKPTQVGTCTTENRILHNIYFNSEFWERPIKEKSINVVQMQAINFSVTSQISKNLSDKNNQLFKQDFENFFALTQQRLNNIMIDHKGSLQNVVLKLMQDAKSDNQSNQFLNLMCLLNKQYDKFDSFYDKPRQERILDLFKQEESIQYSTHSSSANLSEFESPRRTRDDRNKYFIKKFKVLSYLRKSTGKKMESLSWAQVNRSIDDLQQASATFKKIFKMFTLLETSKDQRQTIFKYSYIIQRLIQEYKIITLILFNDKKGLSNINTEGNTTLLFTEDLGRILNDKLFTQLLGEIDVRALKMQFISKFKFNSLTNINEDTLQFFQDLITQDIEPLNPNPKLIKFTVKPTQILLKVAELLKRYYKQTCQTQNLPSEQQRLKVAYKLYQYRNKFLDQVNESSQILFKRQMIPHIVTITRLLAKLMIGLKRLQDAKACYISINDPSSLFQIYEKEYKLHQNNKADRTLQRRHLLQYGKVAIQYKRKDLAMDCYQRAYALSEECMELQQASLLITELSENLSESSEYIDKLMLGKYCLGLNLDIKEYA